ncbi:MAG: VOC family protein [Acidimicrobiales bacterium]
MEIRWLTAFIDMPPESYEAGRKFWQQVTKSRLSAPRGDEAQFSTLIPPDGDAYVRVQRTPSGPRIHLDLHVESIADFRATAEQLGAVVDVDMGHVIMRSPTGLTFCLVPHHGESNRPAPVHQGMEHRLDQVCIDVPASLFDVETRFWEALTGWGLHQGKVQEFAVLTQPASVPLRVLFQRLGDDDGAQSSRAHLDLACGQNVAEIRELHETFGAVFVAEGLVWTTMRDPAGMLYCLTQRDPSTGQL